jgi:hypothetical protein
MALHTGVTEERDGDYFGPPLNRVARLLAATQHHAVVLVISAPHLRDAMNPDRTLRLASAVERFWMRGLVTRGPIEIEPWQHRRRDIELAPWRDVRELLAAQARQVPSGRTRHGLRRRSR